MKHTLLSKLLSVILSLCVLLCMVPVMGLSVSALDATLDTDGTTILISTAEQLAAIGVDENYPRDGAYKLTNDIDLSNFDSDTNPDNGNWTPLCANFSKAYTYAFNENIAFNGTLDGQGYTIKGMKIVDTINSVAHLGLFAHVTTGAKITNIVFKDCSINANVGTALYAGFVVGYCDKDEKIISNIAVIDCAINGVNRNASNGVGIGSIAGSATNAKILNVYSNAIISGGCTVAGNYQVGVAGIAGTAWRGYTTIDGAVFNGTIDVSVSNATYYYKNGIFSLNTSHISTGTAYPTNAGRFTHCYYNSDKLTPLDTATEETDGTNGGHINGVGYTTEQFAQKSITALGLSGDYWCDIDGMSTLIIALPKVDTLYPDYIPIYNAYQLAKIGNDEAYPLSGKYMLMNDIDMSDYGNWTPIAYYTGTKNVGGDDLAFFTGTFDGAGHTISNMSFSVSRANVHAGLFGITKGATIRNLMMTDSSVTTTVTNITRCGIVVGSSWNSTIENVAVYDSVISTSNSAPKNGFATGGILGWSANTTTMKNCYADVDVTAKYTGATGYSNQCFTGGLIGGGWGALTNVTVTDSLFVGSLTSNYYAETTDGYADYYYVSSVLGGSSTQTTGPKNNAECYYLDTVTVNKTNVRGIEGTAITADALKTAYATTLGLDGRYWANDGEGLYLAISPVVINNDGKFEIRTAQQLASIGASDCYPRTGKYILTADIDLSTYGNWTPLCYGYSSSNAWVIDKNVAFNGVLDGQGHTISGMTVNENTGRAMSGLFACVTANSKKQTQIKNLVFKDCSVVSKGKYYSDAAIIAGASDTDNNVSVVFSNIAIIDCSVNSVVTTENGSSAASIIGNGTRAQLYDIYSNATISGGSTVTNEKYGMAGMVGRAYRGYAWATGVIFDGTLENTTVPTEEKPKHYANGVFGLNADQASYATNTVSCKNNYYNSDKLTVSTATNGGEYNGMSLTSFELGISPVSTLGLSNDYWMHNGTTPILKIVGDDEYVNGDATGDGVQDILDLIRVKKYLAKMTDEICPIAVDLKRDQILDALDMAYMKKSLLGLSNAITVKLADAAEDVKYLGATYVENGSLIMTHANTGYEFAAIAEGDITTTLHYVSAGAAGSWPYAKLAVTVDGKTEIIKVYEGTATYKLATDLEYGAHTVKVLKITERTKGNIYASDIAFVGAKNARPADKELKIDFYGDSITAGDGVVKTDRKENVDYIEGQFSNLTYAAKTADALGADMRVIAQSGLKTVNAVSTLRLNEDAAWGYDADIVVINLGTNDWSIISEGGTAATDDGTAAEVKAINDVINAVKNCYGADVKIVWCYGSMGDSKGYENVIKEAVEAYAANNANVWYCSLMAAKNNAGGSGHPTEQGHAAAASVLANFIKTKVISAQ